MTDSSAPGAAVATGSQVSNRWKVLAAGVFANMAFTFTIGGIPAASLFIRDQYQTTTALVGLLMGMIGLGIALSEVPWGIATDRYGDRPVLLLGLGGAAVVMALVAVATQSAPLPGHFAWLMAGLLLTGLIVSSVNGSSGRAIMAWFAVEQRGLAMSIRQTAVPMGYGIGAVVYPWLAAHYGMAGAYSVSAFACVVAAVLAYAWICEPPVEHAARKASSVAAVSPLRSWKVWRVVLAVGILCAPQFAIMTFAMIFLHDQFNIPVASISGLLFVIQMSSILTRISSGRWTDRRQNRKPYLKACSLLCAAAFAALALITALVGGGTMSTLTWLPLAGLLVAGVLVSAWHGVGYTELASEAGSAKVATALAMGNAAVFLVLFVTPSVVPWVAGQLSWASTWGVMALLCVVAHGLFPRAGGRQ